MAQSIRNGLFTGAANKQSVYDLTIPDHWNNKLIVFMHGYMGYKDWGCWNLVSDYFTDVGYGFLKYNVSHNGGTVENPIDFDDLESFGHNSYAFELEDNDAILSLIERKFDSIPEIYLIGHSRGGGIALLQSDKGVVRKVATWAAISDIESRFPKGKEFDAWKADGYYFTKNGRTGQTMPHHFSQYEQFEQHKDRLNIMRYCQNSSTPTLVVHGDEDTSVHIREGKDISRWLDTSLVVIHQTQHTFDSSQPWNESAMPTALQEVCERTLDFFNDAAPKEVAETDEKLSMLSDLINLAKSDDEVGDQELSFLRTIASQLGVTQEEFKAIFEHYIAFNPPKVELDRIVQFQRLILLMNVDLEASEDELSYIRDIGMRMGLHHQAVEEVLKQMYNYPNRVIPPGQLLAIFKTFHN